MGVSGSGLPYGCSAAGGLFLTADGIVTISRISFSFCFLRAQPKTPPLLFSDDFVELALGLTLRTLLPEDSDAVEDVRLVSSSLALLALRAPTVSACWGGTSNVGNMLAQVFRQRRRWCSDSEVEGIP